MRHTLRFLVLIFLAGLLAGRVAGAEMQAATLTIGVVPFNSTRLLLEMHRPLVEHLRGEFGAGVELVTASSFRGFYEETIKGVYDIAVMPAHLARLAQIDHGFVPVARYSVDTSGIVVATANGGITEAAQLVGKTIATPERLALTPIAVLARLEKLGLVAGRDFNLTALPTFNSAVLAIERGEVQAAITAVAPFNQMPAEQRRNLRIVIDTGTFANLVYLAHPRLSAGLREKLTQSLLRFGEAPAGRAFLAATKFGGIATVGRQDMSRLDPFLPETRRQLALRPGP